MQHTIESIRKTRTFLLNGIKDLSIDELNKIPAGFNNNILWNLGHMVASQQGICYLRAGLPAVAGEPFMASYRSGTKPDKFIPGEELDLIRELLQSTLDRFETDYVNGIFINYSPWATRYGVEIKSIEDAAGFLGFHEGLHTGSIMALRRLLNS